MYQKTVQSRKKLLFFEKNGAKALNCIRKTNKYPENEGIRIIQAVHLAHRYHQPDRWIESAGTERTMDTHNNERRKTDGTNHIQPQPGGHRRAVPRKHRVRQD